MDSDFIVDAEAVSDPADETSSLSISVSPAESLGISTSQERRSRFQFIEIALMRVLLFASGVALAIWGSRLMLNRIQVVVSTEAFVNGQIVTLNAPVAGKLTMAAPLRSGMSITSPQPLLTILNPEINQWVREAQLELQAEQSRLQSLTDQLNFQQSHLSSAQDDQQYQIKMSQQQAAIQLAAQAVRQASIHLHSLEAENLKLQTQLNRILPLTQEGALSQNRADDAYHALQNNKNQIEQARIELESSQLKWQHQQQWLQHIPSRPTGLSPEERALEDLVRQIKDSQRRVAAQEQAIAQASLDPKYLDRTITPPFSGVLWENLVVASQEVDVGHPLVSLLNCQQLWVDAFVSIEDLPRIRLGDQARIKLYSSEQELLGRVTTVRSRLTNIQDIGQDVAISRPNLDDRQVAQLHIDLEETFPLKSRRNRGAEFCSVGQLAKVEITVDQNRKWRRQRWRRSGWPL